VKNRGLGHRAFFASVGFLPIGPPRPIVSDPLWDNGNYQKQPPSAQQGFLLARMMIDGVPALQQEVRTPEAADALIHGIKSQTGSGDANDLLYEGV